MFAKTTSFAPLLSSSNWKAVFNEKGLPLDHLGLLRCSETVLFPETKVQILETLPFSICRIQTNEYPAPFLFIDERFLEKVDEGFPERIRSLPTRDQLLERMDQAKGSLYVWGGNCVKGIPEMLSYYPPPKDLSVEQKKIWSFEGVDCSGLLYEASNGVTPRNTSELVRYGKDIPIHGKTINEMIRLMQPLDILVWKGHIVIVFDDKTIIESRAAKGGVVIVDIKDRLEEILSEKKIASPNTPDHLLNEHFFLRRWI